MKRFILGFLLGSILTAPLAYAVAMDIRISDADGDVLAITSGGAITVTF